MKNNVNGLISKCLILCMGALFLLMSCEKSEEIILPKEAILPIRDSVPLLSINELLFDPPSGGVDYVELVNTSTIELDLSHYYITHINTKGERVSGKRLSNTPCYLSSGCYCLVTTDTAYVSHRYSCCRDSLRISLKSLPSMPDDGGTLLLCDVADNIVDECSYSKYWHHSLISKREGISLEKIHPQLPSRQASSWASASTDAGWGTPACCNSQYRSLAQMPQRGFYLDRTLISPSNLAEDAQFCLFYAFEASYVANICIYNHESVPVYRLAENVLLGTHGCFVWQGVSMQGERLPYGYYLIDVVYYDLDGRVFHRQFPCALCP